MIIAEVKTDIKIQKIICFILSSAISAAGHL